jgi:hypothetical protein
MNKFLILIAAFSVFVFSQAVLAQSNYKTYINARFGYSISYPADLLAPQGEADNGDGQIFKNRDAEMRVFGSNMLLKGTLLKEFNSVVKEHGTTVTYKTYRKNYFVVSALSEGYIFYQKTIARSDGVFITFMITYDEGKRKIYDDVVTHIVKTFDRP